MTALLGNYYGFSPRLVTAAEGIIERAPEGCRVVYRTGCPLVGPAAPVGEKAWVALKQ